MCHVECVVCGVGCYRVTRVIQCGVGCMVWNGVTRDIRYEVCGVACVEQWIMYGVGCAGWHSWNGVSCVWWDMTQWCSAVNLEWWVMPVISKSRRLRQENWHEASLGYTARPCLKTRVLQYRALLSKTVLIGMVHRSM